MQAISQPSAGATENLGVIRADAIVERLAFGSMSGDVYRRWSSLRSTHRFRIHKGKRVLAFKVVGGKPLVLANFECQAVELDFLKGFTSTWRERRTNTIWKIGQQPVEIHDGCFMFHSVNSGVDFTEYRVGQFGMLVSMMYRTRRSPNSGYVDTEVYLLEEAVFNRNFPEN